LFDSGGLQNGSSFYWAACNGQRRMEGLFRQIHRPELDRYVRRDLRKKQY